MIFPIKMAFDSAAVSVDCVFPSESVEYDSCSAMSESTSSWNGCAAACTSWNKPQNPIKISKVRRIGGACVGQ